jgi:hypothetical protein
MHATIRRYEGIDQDRAEELTRKVNESLLPRLSEMPGFKSYYLIEADKDHELDRLLRHTRAGQRVDPCRRALGARGETRDGASESAQGHGRRSHRREDEGARRGLTASKTFRSEREGPRLRAFCVFAPCHQLARATLPAALTSACRQKEEHGSGERA